MKEVLIIGANRGIGLGLAKRFSEAGDRVTATARKPRDASELREVVGADAVLSFEVRDETALGALEARFEGVALDVLIHNAGVYTASRSDLMQVNAEAPIRVCERFLPHVADAGGHMILVTSQLGARRGKSGSLGNYGDSKAALNDRFRERCPDWQRCGVTAVVLHPGWVRTDMGGENAAISVEESADGIFSVSRAMTPGDHGRFLTWRGEDHPW
ncbi:MAG: SDR family NAD(P)-dependent oxidoreductase [Myxococcales bacterium]|nr:SDR family NAD(P)-dependent oxidoreductase [Myxococcales bacterium]